MRPLIYYYCLDLPPAQVTSIEASLRELKKLMKHPPLEVDCRIARLPDGIQSRILDDLQCSEFAECAIRVSGTLSDEIGMLATMDPNRYLIPRVIVCCSRQHPLTEKCLTANSKALWGVKNCCLAVVYELGNHCALWHELLHNVGAEDCYDTENPAADPGPTCGHQQCIMQYAPTEGVVDGQLPLCSGNASRIRKLFAEIKD